jgi:hypothetical protein
MCHAVAAAVQAQVLSYLHLNLPLNAGSHAFAFNSTAQLATLGCSSNARRMNLF